MAKKYCPNHPNNRLWAKGLCIECYRKLYAKPLKKTPLAPISDKQKNILMVYRMKRRRYLKEHPMCELHLEDCYIKATDIHHKGKKTSEELWLDEEGFLACCRNCHQKVENSPNLAKQLGIYEYSVLANFIKGSSALLEDEKDDKFY